MKKVTINALKAVIYGEAKDSPHYDVNGKRTDTIENVAIKCYTKEGAVQVLIPPEEGLAARLNAHFSFGEVLNVDDVFDIEDISIGIYKDALSVKFLATLREGVL